MSYDYSNSHILTADYVNLMVDDVPVCQMNVDDFVV